MQSLRTISRALTGSAVVLTAGAFVVVAGTAASAVVPTSPIPVSDFYVGSCAGQGTLEPSIQAAVDAAATGNTIYVCPGTYNEAVNVSKSVILLGAQYGVDASDSTARTSTAGESIIVAPLDSSGNAQPAITYSGSVGGTVNGFTLSGTASPHTDGNAAAPGVLALNGNGGSSWTWTDNIVTGNGEGIQFNTSSGTAAYVASQPQTVISGNRFDHNNNNQTDNRSGGGIFNTNGVMNNVTINGNLFLDNGNTGAANGDINTTGDGCSDPTNDTTFAHGDVISNNTAIQDAGFEDNFVVLFCTKGLQVTGNTVTYTTANDPNADSDMYISGGNYDAVFSNNTLSGGNAKGFNVNTVFYGGSTGIQITGNHISNRAVGVYITGSNTAFTVSANTITGSTSDGIQVTAATGGGSIHDNAPSGSTTFDCADSTTGSGTAGTADTWTNNSGATSSPAGLCSPDATPALPEVPMAALLPITALVIGGGTVLLRRRRAA